MKYSRIYHPWKFACTDGSRTPFRYLSVERLAPGSSDGVMVGTNGIGLGVIPVTDIGPGEEGLVMADSLHEIEKRFLIKKYNNVVLQVEETTISTLSKEGRVSLPRKYDATDVEFPLWRNYIPTRYPRERDLHRGFFSLDIDMLDRFASGIGLKSSEYLYPQLAYADNKFIHASYEANGTYKAPFFIIMCVLISNFNLPEYDDPTPPIKEEAE